MNSGLPDSQGGAAPPPRLALLACAVFEREIELLSRGAAHLVEVRWFEMGLHDSPERMRAALQRHLNEVDARDDIDAVVLAYGLCGRGTVGLHCSRHRLVLARAHDCITMFLGGRAAHAEHQRRFPGSFFYTPGWNRDHRVPGPDRLESLRAEYSRTYEPEDVDYLMDVERGQWALHDTATYVELGTDDAEAGAAYARRCADWLGWRFQRIHGDPSLLRDLIWGRWDDERFQVVPPGMQIGHAPDANLLRAEPVVRT